MGGVLATREEEPPDGTPAPQRLVPEPWGCAFCEFLFLNGVPYMTHISKDTCVIYGTVAPDRLHSMTVSNCQQLETLPEDMPALNNLTISHCRVLRMIPVLPVLRRLVINHCASLSTLDAATLVQSLTHLELKQCVFTVLPDALCQLTALGTLTVMECERLTCLPSSLGNLCKLQSLFVLGCPLIPALPESMGNLASLAVLKSSVPILWPLPHNTEHLYSVHDVQHKFKPLRVTLSNLACVSLSEGLFNTCTTLELNGCNALTAMPGGLASLERLHVEDAIALIFVPDDLSAMASLTTLNLERCPCLTRLAGLGDLCAAHHIIIHHCGITVLPDSLCNLSQLQTLSLRGCEALTCLPTSIGYIGSLRHLDILSTRVHRLPASLGYTSSVRFSGTKHLTFPPPHIKIHEWHRFMQRHDASSSILLLALAASRRDGKCLPPELWDMFLERFYYFSII